MSQTIAFPTEWTKALERPRQITTRKKEELAQIVYLTNLLDGQVHGFQRSNILGFEKYKANSKQGSAVKFNTRNSGDMLEFLASETPHEISMLLQGRPTPTQRAQWEETLLRLRDEEQDNMRAVLKDLHKKKQAPITQAHETRDAPELQKITNAVNELGFIRARREARWLLLGKAFAAATGMNRKEKQQIADLNDSIQRSYDLRGNFARAKADALRTLDGEYQTQLAVMEMDFSAQETPEWIAAQLDAFEDIFVKAMKSYEPKMPGPEFMTGDDHFMFGEPEVRGRILDFPNRQPRVHTNVPNPHAGQERHHDL